MLLVLAGSSGFNLKNSPMTSSALVTRSWNGHSIQRRRADGYVNATAMCQVAGKHWKNYAQLLRSAEYIKALEGSAGIPADLLAQTVLTGPNAGRGTWVHPRLAVDLARWISPEFAVWMDGWILEEMEAKAKPARHQAIQAEDAAAIIALACAEIGGSLSRLAALTGHPPTATAACLGTAADCLDNSRRLLDMVDRLLRTIPAAKARRAEAA